MISKNYVFWYRRAVFRITSSTLQFIPLPKDGSAVPKHVGVGTYHELSFYYLYFLVLYDVVYWFVIEYKKLNGMNLI
jgi:hypothetical protein